MIFRTVAAVFLGIMLLTYALAGAAPAASAASSATPFSDGKPVSIVILADESASMRTYKNEIAGEQQAAAAIVQAAWSPRSRVAIYGFGSAPPGSTGGPSAAVTELCGPTLDSPANVGTLTKCAQKITPRPPGEDHTDFASALTVAEDVLAAASPQQPRLVFLLTDGKLSVGDQNANATAQADLTATILPAMRKLGIQIWPVGFGHADQGELRLFARGAAQGNSGCQGSPNAVPQPALVPPAVNGADETEQIQDQLLKAFAAASCGTFTHGKWKTLPPGGTVSRPVTVNALTTNGSIVVNKGNPGVTVTYADPNNVKLSDSTPAVERPPLLDGAPYVLATGPQSPQEALRLDNPVTGQWTVTFTNKTKTPQRVDAAVVWQGEVVPNITFSPDTGDSGRPVQIQVSPTFDARRIPLADLEGLSVSLAVRWVRDGPVLRYPATLDKSTGEFVRTVRVPAGRKGGIATVTATVREAGVQGTVQSPLSYQPGGGLSLTLSPTGGKRVTPGTSLTVHATASNVDQPAASIQFLLAGIGSADAQVIQPTGPVRVLSGGGQVIPVTIHFGPQTRGEVEGTLMWEVTGTTLQHPAGLLDVKVEPPSTPWYEQWWPYTLLFLLLAGTAGGLYARRRVLKNRKIAEEKKRQHQETERVRANLNVQDAGLALVRRGKAADAPYIRWSGGYRAERWFTVDRRASGHPGDPGIPVLTETTGSGTGQLVLRRNPDGAFLVSADGTAESAPESEPARAPVTPEAEGQPFDPPEGTGLDDCQLVVTRGAEAVYTPPDPRYTELLHGTDEHAGLRHALTNEDYDRPPPIDYDDSPDDGTAQ